MQHWPWWLGGPALAAIAVGNWLLVRRMMSVSGRLTALVDRAIGRSDAAPEMSSEELAEAVRLMTLQEFGEAAVDAPAPAGVDAPDLRVPRSTVDHVVFLSAVLAGGLLSALAGGTLTLSHPLRGEAFGALFGTGWGAAAVLCSGGVLVGFGTRMASGCTSGHGLCGVSRGQRGSLLATAAFFGMGAAASFLLGRL